MYLVIYLYIVLPITLNCLFALIDKLSKNVEFMYDWTFTNIKLVCHYILSKSKYISIPYQGLDKSLIRDDLLIYLWSCNSPICFSFLHDLFCFYVSLIWRLYEIFLAKEYTVVQAIQTSTKQQSKERVKWVLLLKIQVFQSIHRMSFKGIICVCFIW